MSTAEYGLTWGEPAIVNTKEGVRSLRTSPPTDAFWRAWRGNKDGLKAKGFTVTRPLNGDWMVGHWTTPSAAPSKEDSEAQTLLPLPRLNRPDGLLKYQIPAVQGLVRALRSGAAALDASDTGTGKTYAALAAARELSLTPTVICPKTVIPSWQRAAAHLGISIEPINYEKVRNGNSIYGQWGSEKINGKLVERFIWAGDTELLIFDECHRCKGVNTANAGLMIAAALQDIPTIAASATAATDPMEMRALGFLLGLHGLRDFYAWAAAHGCYQNQWDGWEFGGSDDDIQTIHRGIFPGKGVRIKIADLGDQFPQTQIAVELIPVASPDKIDKAYTDVRDAIAAVRQRAAGDSTNAEHLTAQLRARQVSELQKIPALVELAKDALAEKRSIFIGVNFNDSLDTLKESFGNEIVAIVRGDQTAEDRERNIAAFQADKARIIIANLKAGGVGVSLHDLNGRFPRTALICPGWSATDLKQALGRVWRSGGKSTSIQRILYAAGTVEETVAARIEEKLRNLSLLNDGVHIKLTDEDLQ